MDEYLEVQFKVVRDGLDLALKEGRLDFKTYNRNMAELGYSFALYGFIEECLATLLVLPENYFIDDGYEIIKSDNEFAEKCELIFDTLAFFGYSGYIIDATQTEGKA